MGIVSAAPSVITLEARGDTSVKYGCDFGDLFVQDSNEAMRHWMTASTVYEFDDANNPMSAPFEAGTARAPTEYNPDSDSDLEKDLLRTVFAKGKSCKDIGDLSGAERQFGNCPSRLHAFSGPSSRASLQRSIVAGMSRSDLLELLTDI
jgi:hypothetical protein